MKKFAPDNIVYFAASEPGFSFALGRQILSDRKTYPTIGSIRTECNVPWCPVFANEGVTSVDQIPDGCLHIHLKTREGLVASCE